MTCSCSHTHAGTLFLHIVFLTLPRALPLGNPAFGGKSVMHGRHLSAHLLEHSVTENSRSLAAVVCLSQELEPLFAPGGSLSNFL